MAIVDHAPAPTEAPLWQILEAISEGQVHPHYQPIVSLTTGDVVAVEALARWRVPDLGTLPATAFVPVLERCRRVTDLTAYMLDRACADLAAWQRDLPLRPGFRVAINVSATELGDRRLTTLVREALGAHRIAPHSICLEVTETARIDDMQRAAAVLAELASDIGVRLALDDFGTGFADGEYLEAFPFDTVKIDQSFVAGMGHRDDHAAFVRATVGYAKHRAMGVVAEGVQQAEQARALLTAGCRVAQGFGLGMPTPAEQILDTRFGAAELDGVSVGHTAGGIADAMVIDLRDRTPSRSADAPHAGTGSR